MSVEERFRARYTDAVVLTALLQLLYPGEVIGVQVHEVRV